MVIQFLPLILQLLEKIFLLFYFSLGLRHSPSLGKICLYSVVLKIGHLVSLPLHTYLNCLLFTRFVTHMYLLNAK